MSLCIVFLLIRWIQYGSSHLEKSHLCISLKTKNIDQNLDVNGFKVYMR